MVNITSFGDVANVQGNVFQQPHRKIFTGQFGKLMPSMVKEIIPGDVMDLRVSKLTRVLPMLAPIMSNCTLVEDFFFVPNRILWDGWKAFITGDETTAPEFPLVDWDTSIVPSNTLKNQTNAAYLGMPVTVESVPEFFQVSALPIAALNAIYNQYYRNDYLQAEKIMKCNDGNTNDQLTEDFMNELYLRNWKKDYFFGSTPTPQHGVSVLLPLTNTSELEIGWRLRDTLDPTPIFRNKTTGTAASGAISAGTGNITAATSGTPVSYDPKGSLFVNANADAVTIDSVKTAFAMQTFLERDLTGGLKYIENIKTHFGVIIPDFTAQVPEWIGSASQYLEITEVLSKSEVTTETSTIPLGSYAGHGFSAGSSDNIHHRFTEHGFVISIISIIPELIYPNTGLRKHWLKTDRFDYAYPTFAELGMQPVLRNEIYLGFTDNVMDDEIWGYRPIFDDLRSELSVASGLMTDDLDYWVNYIKLASAGAINLNDQSIKINQRVYDLDRIFSIDTNGPAEQITDYIYLDCHYDLQMYRLLPRFNIPNIS